MSHPGTADSLHRGHAITLLGDVWLYEDTGKPVAEDPNRPCGDCGRANTTEGHDGCLGTLDSVMNACCGHGTPRDAYVQFDEDDSIRGRKAIAWIKNELIERRQEFLYHRAMALFRIVNGSGDSGSPRGFHCMNGGVQEGWLRLAEQLENQKSILECLHLGFEAGHLSNQSDEGADAVLSLASVLDSFNKLETQK